MTLRRLGGFRAKGITNFEKAVSSWAIYRQASILFWMSCLAFWNSADWRSCGNGESCRKKFPISSSWCDQSNIEFDKFSANSPRCSTVGSAGVGVSENSVISAISIIYIGRLNSEKFQNFYFKCSFKKYNLGLKTKISRSSAYDDMVTAWHLRDILVFYHHYDLTHKIKFIY